MEILVSVSPEREKARAGAGLGAFCVGVSGAEVRLIGEWIGARGGRVQEGVSAGGGVGLRAHLNGALGLDGGAIGGGGGEGEVRLAAQLGGQLVLDLARVAGKRDLADEVLVLVAIILGGDLRR
jgi:hypothetical protein